MGKLSALYYIVNLDFTSSATGVLVWKHREGFTSCIQGREGEKNNLGREESYYCDFSICLEYEINRV